MVEGVAHLLIYIPVFIDYFVYSRIYLFKNVLINAAMGSQEDTRSAGTLGFVGSILMLIPYVSIVGDILVLIALYRLSRAYGNNAIWSNALYALVTAIVSGIILAFVLAGTAYLSLIYMGPGALSRLGMAIAFFVAFYIIILISGFFLRNAYNELGRSSGVGDFESAARWYWLGAILTIIIVGLILYIVADVYAILGYSKLRG